MLKHIQVTLGAAATPAIAAKTPCVFAVAQPDDGNSNPVFFGGAGVTTATGLRLQNSATDPPRQTFGPFGQPEAFNLAELFFVGTATEKVNICYVEA